MKFLLCCALMLAGGSAIPAAADENGPPSLVSTVSGYARPFKVIATRLDSTAKEAEVTMQGDDGIFAFNFVPPKMNVKKVTFIVLKVKACEGFTFTPEAGNAVQLREAAGFATKRRGEDLVIEITEPALGVLVRGGKVQFVDRYR